MRYFAAILLACLLAAPASATTVFVCRGSDPMQPACGVDCIIDAWDVIHDGCNEPVDTDSAEFLSYRDRQPTQAMKDQAFEDDLLGGEVFRALIRTISEVHGVTVQQLIEKLKDNR